MKPQALAMGDGAGGIFSLFWEANAYHFRHKVRDRKVRRKPHTDSQSLGIPRYEIIDSVGLLGPIRGSRSLSSMCCEGPRAHCCGRDLMECLRLLETAFVHGAIGEPYLVVQRWEQPCLLLNLRQYKCLIIPCGTEDKSVDR